MECKSKSICVFMPKNKGFSMVFNWLNQKRIDFLKSI